MPLETEIQAYESLKGSLLAEAGKYAVISKTSLLGIFSSYEDALKIGYEKCKLAPFLVKKIQVVEPVHFFSRSLEPAR